MRGSSQNSDAVTLSVATTVPVRSSAFLRNVPYPAGIRTTDSAESSAPSPNSATDTQPNALFFPSAKLNAPADERQQERQKQREVKCKHLHYNRFLSVVEWRKVPDLPISAEHDLNGVEIPVQADVPSVADGYRHCRQKERKYRRDAEDERRPFQNIFHNFIHSVPRKKAPGNF